MVRKDFFAFLFISIIAIQFLFLRIDLVFWTGIGYFFFKHLATAWNELGGLTE